MKTEERYEAVVLARHRDGPYRWYAHFASYDGPGSSIGHGQTPGDAVNDLFDVVEIDT
jgi:hypothetical protein